MGKYKTCCGAHYEARCEPDCSKKNSLKDLKLSYKLCPGEYDHIGPMGSNCIKCNRVIGLLSGYND